MVIRWQFLDTIIGNLFPLLMLCARWKLDCDIAVQSLDEDIGTQHSLANVQVQIGVDVSTISFKIAVVTDFDMDDQVTVRTTYSCVTLLRHS